MKQLTTEEAIQFHDLGVWEGMTLRERALFQMEQDCLCMPFDKFHEAVEKTLGRPVFTHEFGLNRDGIRAELAGTGPAPSFDQILAMLPPDKTIVIAVK